MLKINSFFNWQLLRHRLHLHQMRPNGITLPLLCFLLVTLILVNFTRLFHSHQIWENHELAAGNAFQFCEANHLDNFIRQPANTWSNLGFLLVSFIVFSIGIHDYKNKNRKSSNHFLVRRPLYTLFFATACLYLFVGSFFYHASLTHFFQKMDQSGMYAVAIVVMIFNLYHLFPTFHLNAKLVHTHNIGFVIILISNIFIYKNIAHLPINLVFPILISFLFFVGFYTANFSSRTTRFINYLKTSLAVLSLAFCSWILDRTHTLCNPTSVWQGHALWHILCAVSILLVYLYYRSHADSETLLEKN